MTQSEVIKTISELRDKAIDDCAKAGMRSSRGYIKYYHHGKRVGFEDVLTICQSDDIYPDWISLTEREPDDTTVVLVTTDLFPDGYVTTALYEDGEFNVLGDVIAWMPFPSPYKGGHR